MHKFKIGDRVKVVDEQKMQSFCVPSYAARAGTVEDLSPDNSSVRSVRIGHWWYPEDCLELIDRPITEEVPDAEPKTYTVRKVLDAYWKYRGYTASPSEMSIEGTQKILEFLEDPDYNTYLELQKRFEI